jgi:hypothetical protein
VFFCHLLRKNALRPGLLDNPILKSHDILTLNEALVRRLALTILQ